MNFKEWQAANGTVPDTTVSPRGLVVGDQVHILATTEAPHEFGVVISINEQWPANDPRSINNAMIVVEVYEAYRDCDGDDGLRECSDDQVEKL